MFSPREVWPGKVTNTNLFKGLKKENKLKGKKFEMYKYFTQPKR